MPAIRPSIASSIWWAITGPAQACGLRVESALIDAILADVPAASRSQSTGVLPRLSQAMMATWEKREGDELTAAGYARSGRVARAVEVSAEDAYGELPAGQQEIVRDVFRQLTAIGHDHQPISRPVTRTELRASSPKDQWSAVGVVLDAFARRRLLVVHAFTLKCSRLRRRVRERTGEGLAAFDEGFAPHILLHALGAGHPRATGFAPPR